MEQLKVSVSDNMIGNIRDVANVSAVSNELHQKMGNRNTSKGFVEIYENTEDGQKLISKQNLMVYAGREVILQRVLNMDRDAANNPEKDLFISWLSVGNGGATAADPLTPLVPTLADTGLGGDGSTELVIDNLNASYADSGKKKPFDMVEFLADNANNDRYLIAKITTTLVRTECNTNNINEAGLWFSDSSIGSNVTKFRLCSRVCFSTVEKNPNRELVMIWYLFF